VTAKKIVGLLWLSILAGLMLVACGASEATPTNGPTLSPTTAASVVTTSSAGAATTTVAASNIKPPTQPTSGPGGSTYPHGSVKQTAYGSGAEGYTIFEPADPTPKSAPVVVFLHGFIAINPNTYSGWIEHIVRRGNIVVYPAYQMPLSGQEVFVPSMLKGVSAGLETLKDGKHVTPELDKLTITGHSLGGFLTVALAALAGHEGAGAAIPSPKAIMVVEPGACMTAKCTEIDTNLGNRVSLSQIPASLKMLMIVGDRDQIVGDLSARLLWRLTPQIAETNKDYITLVSDEHGSPALVASHFVPSSGAQLNALNYYGLMKLFDALQSCTLYNQNCDVALGGGPAQRYMGQWSDGRQVNELQVTKKPQE
jgi:hypothetical protein